MARSLAPKMIQSSRTAPLQTRNLPRKDSGSPRVLIWCDVTASLETCKGTEPDLNQPEQARSVIKFTTLYGIRYFKEKIRDGSHPQLFFEMLVPRARVPRLHDRQEDHCRARRIPALRIPDHPPRRKPLPVRRRPGLQ